MAKAKEKTVAAYDVPALVITPEQPLEITGNYAAIEKTLQQWKATVAKMKLTEDNIEEVTTIKKAAVAVRNNLDRVATATKKALFNDPKAIFDARVKALFSLVADVEGSADAVLDKLEEQRVTEANQVLDSYKDDFQKQYQLDPAYLERVEYKKDFYNKTVPKGYSSMDKYWKESLEQQFKELKKEQNAMAANIRLIEATCKDEPRLNVQHWIDRFQHDDVATITEAIVAEKERLCQIDAQPEAATQTASTAQEATVETGPESEETTVVLGIPSGINFNTDFPGRTKSMKVQIIYPCDLGDALTELFKSIKPYGIKVRQLVEEAAF